MEEISREFAIAKHKNYYGTYQRGKIPIPIPYIYHLDRVNEIVMRFGFINEQHLTDSAYLHDILEDTCTQPVEITSKFGPNVTKIVSNLTDEPGETREIRKSRTYPKIKGKRDETIIKLADRIANIEHVMYIDENSKVLMYMREMPDFFQGIYNQTLEKDLRIRNMWNMLIMYYAFFYGGDFHTNYMLLTDSKPQEN